MIPSNHPLYPFPYNLEDRASSIKQQIKEINSKINVEIKKQKSGEFFTINIHIKDDVNVKDNIDKMLQIFEKWSAQKQKDDYVIELK